jgi:hypothetical protein
MFDLSLEFVRQIVDPRVRGVHVELIKVSGSPSTVHRLCLDYGATVPVEAPRSLVAKRIAPDWPDDPPGRERIAYAEILLHLDIRKCHVYYAGLEPDSRYRLVVLEDVYERYRFPQPHHVWTWDEMRSILGCYARLHTSGVDALRHLPDRSWAWAGHSVPCAPEEALRQAADLHAWGIWPSLPPMEPLLYQVESLRSSMVAQPETVLHNDVYPPNIGLPHTVGEPCQLLDWEMIGAGAAEFDLAFMFMLPYRSTRMIDRQAALDEYWAVRYALDGTCKSRDERDAVQWYADAAWSLYLLGVAHRVAQKPFAQDSAPAHYWAHMHAIVHEQFVTLCAVRV